MTGHARGVHFGHRQRRFIRRQWVARPCAGPHSPRRRVESGRASSPRPGLARSTVAARLDALQAAGWISSGQTTTARGRPPSHFHVRTDGGALLIADAGATGVRTAVTDLRGQIGHELRIPLDITVGPERWLAEVGRLFDELLEKSEIAADFVRGIGIAVPGPVDFASATVVSPPIMTGWDGYPIRSWFETASGARCWWTTTPTR